MNSRLVVCCFLAGLTLGAAGSAAAAPAPTRAAPVPAAAPAPARGAVLQEGGAVEFCDEGSSCRSSRHPLAAGTVRQIVTGDFVKAAQTSWIALGDGNVSLCYLGADSAAITCTPIVDGAESIKGTQIAYQDADDGAGTLRFSAGAGAGEPASRPYLFMSALGAAADVLQKHAARPRAGAGSGAGDVCAFVDGAHFACTGAAAGPAVADAGAVRRGADRGAGARVAPAAYDDGQSIATVDTGSAGQPTPQVCKAEATARMKNCDSLRNRPQPGAHRSCVANVETMLHECLADVDAGAGAGSASGSGQGGR